MMPILLTARATAVAAATTTSRAITLAAGAAPTSNAATGRPPPPATRATDPTLASHPAAQIIAALIVVGVVVVLCGVAATRLRGAVLGKDNRLSTSKTTALVWTLFVAYAYLTEMLVVFPSAGQGVPNLQKQLAALPADNYLLLLGGPFAALVAAKGIVVSRLANGTLQKSTASQPSIKPTDLVSDDSGQVDLVDLQFVLFNLVALVYAAGLFIHHPMQGLPPIPDGLAGLTSVAALTYVGNKAVSQNVPLIQSFTPGIVRAGALVALRGVNLLPPSNNDDLNKTNGVLEPLVPTVTIAGLPAAVLNQPAATATQIWFRVPDGVPAGPAEVVVTSPGDSPASATSTLTVEADSSIVVSVVPDQARIGANLTVLGHNLLDPRADDPTVTNSPSVTVGGLRADLQPGMTNDRLVVKLGNNLPGGAQQLILTRGAVIATPLTVTVCPTILSTTPDPLPAGQDLTLVVTGTGLPDTGSGPQLTLDGHPLTVSTWSAGQLVADVPARALTRTAGQQPYRLELTDALGNTAALDIATS